MDKRIGVLALASFAMGTEAYVYAGHLEALAREMEASLSSAGQLATVFAITYAVSAPFVAAIVSRFGRRSVITSGLVLIGLLNLSAAFAPSLSMLLAIRFLCGLAAGLVGPMSSVAAAELAPPEKRGKALALVMAGVTLAFVLGIPTGSVIGDFAGWRGTFVYAGAIALVAAAAIRQILPALPGGTRADARHFGTALQGTVPILLLLTLIGFAATFTTIAYVGPVVTRITGLTGSGIGAMQMMVGFGSIIGIIVGGQTADRPGGLAILRWSFIVSSLALSTYSLLMLYPVSGNLSVETALLAIGIMTGAASLFARMPLIQTALVNAIAPETRPVILALNGSMVFFGQGLGAAIGGLVIQASGLHALGFTSMAVATAGFLLALGLRTPTVQK